MLQQVSRLTSSYKSTCMGEELHTIKSRHLNGIMNKRIQLIIGIEWSRLDEWTCKQWCAWLGKYANAWAYKTMHEWISIQDYAWMNDWAYKTMNAWA